jgi:hypothetical protein
MISSDSNLSRSMAFADLESRFGATNARTILRTMEMFEGILEERVMRLSPEERLKNVMRMMKENLSSQTRH